MPSQTVPVGSRIGLHARPAALIAEAVGKAGVPVTLATPGGKPVDAGSPPGGPSVTGTPALPTASAISAAGRACSPMREPTVTV